MKVVTCDEEGSSSGRWDRPLSLTREYPSGKGGRGERTRGPPRPGSCHPAEQPGQVLIRSATVFFILFVGMKIKRRLLAAILTDLFYMLLELPF